MASNSSGQQKTMFSWTHWWSLEYDRNATLERPLSGESVQVRANVFLDGLCMALTERSGGTAAEQTATQKPASHN